MRESATASSARPVAVFTTTAPVTMNTFCTGLVAELAKSHDVVLVTSPGAPLAPGGTRRVTSVPIRMTRRVSPLQDLGSLIHWCRLLRRTRPDVVIAATPKAAFLAMTAALLFRIRRRVYLQWGLRLEGATGLRRVVLYVPELIACRAAHVVIANSPSLSRKLEAVRLTGRGRVVSTDPGSSHGVDCEYFRPRPPDGLLRGDLGLLEGLPVVGFVGRVTHDKGLDRLIAALEVVNREEVRAQLLVIGPSDEPDSEKLLHDVRDTTFPAIYAGPKSDLRPFYALMSVLALPSRREGFPNVVLEAAAMGVPCVTTTATGCVDSVVHGVTGWLVPTEQISSLADVLADVLQQPEVMQQFGGAARRRVQEEFEPDRITRQVVDAATAGPRD